MKIKIQKKQIIAAGLMLVMSIGPIAASYLYTPVHTVSMATPKPQATRQHTDSIDAVTASLPAVDVVEEEVWEPTPGYLNLTHYFPDGADTTRIEESYAGEAFKVLMERDADWMDNLYEYADLTPAQLARRLGKSGSSVTGKYNPKDNRHKASEPNTWTINSFKRIRMNVTNGDGQTINTYSNVIDIMAMANLYTYFNGIENHELFLSYAENLWEKSHSYSVSMSSIYYCEGCLSEEDELRELAELEAEALAEEEALKQTLNTETESAATEAPQKVMDNTTKTAESAAETSSAVIEAGTAAAEPETASAAATEPVETEPESTSGVITSSKGQTQAAAESSSETTVSQHAEAESSEAETTNETPAASSAESITAILSGLITGASPSNAESGTPPAKAVKDKEDTSAVAYKCPGHVDLIINAKVLGLQENNGLLAKDNIGNNAEQFKEDGWQGWNNYTIASVRLHSSQDWYEKYGLTVSVFSMRNPLSEAEIDEYLKGISENLSAERAELVRFALSSVGKVPYYWGGKPSAPDYAGNSFGVMVSPDYKGRILKGLDCSGWINWVYWSVTGEKLAYEGTSGLALLGTKVSRSELKPGDIIIRTGEDAHVIMFLGWTDDGRILCVHESSGKTNNVTVAVRDANWPYYRKLLD